MKTLLSLFDYTGTWSDPFYQYGWEVIQLDIKHGHDILDVISAEYAIDNFENVDGIIAAPPCTHFSVSGAQYWKEKDADGRTEEHIAFVRKVQQLADLFRPTDPDWYEEEDNTFFWCVENPVGRLPKLIKEFGKPKYIQPHEYAGHVHSYPWEIERLDRIRAKNGIDVTAEETEFIVRLNAYTKKTGLWGEFNRALPRKPIEPVRASKHGSPLMRLGGSSERTKTMRSRTPEGFAQAFAYANCDWKPEY